MFVGTPEERGLLAWKAENPDKVKHKRSGYVESSSIYEPLFPKRWRHHPLLKYIPFLPNPSPLPKEQEHVHIEDDNCCADKCFELNHV